MKEIPILMTPENARKCHYGTKTQTRRIVKLPLRCPAHGVVLNSFDPRGEHDADILVNCHYGVVGDWLWVREAWRMSGEYADVSTTKIKPEDAWLYTDHLLYRGETHSEGVDKWRSSMMMPKWACRTWLEITEVRVQRLQEISEEDAREEGVELGFCGSAPGRCDDNSCRNPSSYRDGFKVLWESINGPGSWEQNPWVWAISFRKVAP